MDLVMGTGEDHMAIRVHSADEHTMFRESLAAFFASQDEVEVVGASSTGEEVRALLEQSTKAPTPARAKPTPTVPCSSTSSEASGCLRSPTCINGSSRRT